MYNNSQCKILWFDHLILSVAFEINIGIDVHKVLCTITLGNTWHGGLFYYIVLTVNSIRRSQSFVKYFKVWTTSL